MKMTKSFTPGSPLFITVMVGAAVGYPLRIPAIALYGVTVNIGQASWQHGGCLPPPAQTVPPTNLWPVLTSKCAEMDVYAEGTDTYYDGVNCDTDVHTIYATFPDPIDHGTGCKIVIVTNSNGFIQWHVSEPKHSGSIEFHADISNGYCPNPGTRPPCNVSAQWHAAGTLQVSLPPCEDQGGSCGCSTCTSQSTPALGSGNVNNNDNSLDFRMQLGSGGTLIDAGYAWLNTNAPSPALAQPSALTVPFARPSTVVLLDPSSNYVSQILAPQGLVNVYPVTLYEFHLDCYYASQVVGLVGNYYATNSGATPFVTWIVKNPDTNFASNRLFITEQRGSSQRLFQFTYNSATLRWDLVLPDSLTTQSDWLVQGSDSTLTNYFHQISSGSQVFKSTQKLQKYVTGLNYLLLMQEIDGNGTTTNITTYTYYSSNPTNGSSTNLLQRVDYSDGRWVYYDYDVYGRVSRMYSAYSTNPPPPSTREPNALTDGCKQTDYYYTLDATADHKADNGSINPGVVRKTIVSVPVGSQLCEISRTYHYVQDYVQEETMECPNPGALWDDTANLHTVTYKYYHDPANYETGLPEYVFRPDGTASYFTYAADRTQTIEEAGQPSVWGNETASIIDGTETETDIDSQGRITARTLTDISSGVTISKQTYYYNDTNSNPLDPLGRSYLVTDLAGRTNQYWYACCALDHVIDPDNVTTYYIYDNNLKNLLGTRRVVYLSGSTEYSISTTNVLDAANRVLVTQRVGTNGNTIVTGQWQYDVLGRTINQTNALGGVIGSTYSIYGPSCKTNVFPDGGTRIEFYNGDGTLAMVTGTAVQPVRYVYAAEQDGAYYRAYTKEIKLQLNGTDSSEWTKTYTDGAGHAYKTLYAAPSTPYPAALSIYNSAGQLWKEVDPDGVTNIHAFNPKGELEYNIVALSSTILGMSYSALSNGLYGGALDLSTLPDRVTRTQRSVQAAGNKPDLVRFDTFVWDDSFGSGTLVSRSETATTGQHSWQTVYGDAGLAVVTETTNVLSTGGYRYSTNIGPSGSYTTTTFYRGRVTSVARFDSSRNQIGRTDYAYDAHGRQGVLTDARNGATTYAFNNADLVSSVTTPNPGTVGGTVQITATYYDLMLRPTNTVNPDTTSTLTEYYVTGQTKRQYGARTYPVGYGYDYAGRMTSMTNWSNFAAGTGARVTTWNYNQYRGWLDNKRFPDNTGPSYTYTAAGRLQVRSWARGIGTTNIYDAAGLLSGVNYSDTTPWVSNTYDRRGRQKTVLRNGTTTSFVYNNANQVLVETNSGGTLDTIAVTNAYDQFLRRTNLVARQSGNILVLDKYSYDPASRLQVVTDNSAATPYSAMYAYVANSPLVSQITFKQSTTVRMITTKQWDFLNRLSSIINSPSADSEISFAYAYNTANQRTRISLADGSFWQYTYDRLGQVVSGHKFFADQTPVAGQLFDYSFDDIGNRTQTLAGGDQTGANQRVANYYANTLNQYTNRDVPGYVDIMGLAYATNPVTVNATTAYRHGEYFRQQLPIGNSSSAEWTNITVSAPGQTTISGNEFVAKTPEGFAYDADGNLTNDGRWNYGWDAENRLIAMTNDTSVGPQQVLHFEYDWKSRRIHKQVYPSGPGVATNDLKFAYDGWNLLAEVSSTNSPVRTYTWGLDLSGSVQGAGGIGGLLESVYYASAATNAFAAFDGSGNVAALVNAAGGTMGARYEYDPFGGVLRNTGFAAKTNSLRFSTKYQDDETDLSYYGFRYLSPSQARWISRDPLAERAPRKSSNLYGFVQGNAISKIDPIGLLSDEIITRRNCCDCLSVSVNYHPGGNQLDFDYYVTSFTWSIPPFLVRFGSQVEVTWAVEGNPSRCHYYQDEGKTWTRVDWTHPPHQGRPQFGQDGHPASQHYTDEMGVNIDDLPARDFILTVHWDVVFRCVSSGGETKTKEDVFDVSRTFISMP